MRDARLVLTLMMRSHALVALMLAGCADVSDEAPVACTGAAIFGGRPTSALGVRAGVVGVLVEAEDGSGFGGLCSGVLVAPRAVLSAAHCFGGRARSNGSAPAVPRARVVFVGLQGSPLLEVDVERAAIHPELDLALLELDSRELTDVAGAVLPLHLDALDASWVGSAVELSGFGATESGELGQLAFVTEKIVRIEANHIVVDGRGTTGACIGDSGGPLVGRTSDGRSEVLGVLDEGSESCTGEDFYTRLDRVAYWEPLAARVAIEGPCRP